MDAELLQEFLIECQDSWQALDEALLNLEEHTDDLSYCDAAFRGVHNIKGAAGFMEATVLESVSHAAENVLDQIRAGKMLPGPEAFSALFQASDKIHDLLDALRAGEELQADDDLVARLKQLTSPLTDLTASWQAPSAGIPESLNGEPTVQIAALDASIETQQSTTVVQAEPEANHEEALPNVILFGAPNPRRSAAAETPNPPATAPTAASPPPTELSPSASGAPAPAPTLGELHVVTPPRNQAPRGDASPKVGAVQEDTSVRVDVALLDDVMNLVGELVVCRNQILRVPDERIDDELGPSIRRLNHLTSHIQERVMKTRMQPIGSAWSRLPRLVRDLASSCGKQCELKLSGEHVELDRSILAQIKDPLVHMVRNAVDHGLEPPEERSAAGKTPKGVVRLTADHVGGQVHIELRDDGRGLNADAILAKAIERGLVTIAQAEAMTLDEIHQLIFEAGFSTAESVSKLSGRGVGMDVVRSNLTKIGGTVDVNSVAGSGSVIKLKIPLTLAILPALIVRCGPHSFAIPQAHLVELIDLEFGTAHTLEHVGDVPVLRRRGELLPLLNIDEVLGLEECDGAREFVVVLQADESSYGLRVDSVEEVEEIVVKPLGPELDSVHAFSGATVRGDGSIALILDVVRLGRVTSSGNSVGQAKEASEAVPPSPLLRFRVADEGVAAVDVRSVVRIEDVSAGQLELHNGRHFIVWQDQIVPVTDLAGLANVGAGPLPIVVCTANDATVAFAVVEVLDVVDVVLTVSEGIGAAWASGMALVEGQPTSLLDLDLLQAA